MLQTFEEQIRQIHTQKIKEERWQRHLKEIRGENIYLQFCIWCNCQGLSDKQENVGLFAKWLKQENITLTEYQRRWLAENHFGWKFTWNEEKKEWESRKNG